MASNEIKASVGVVKRRKCAKFYQKIYEAVSTTAIYHAKYLMKQGNRFNSSDGWNLVR